jgi:hypothetical protein
MTPSHPRRALHQLERPRRERRHPTRRRCGGALRRRERVCHRPGVPAMFRAMAATATGMETLLCMLVREERMFCGHSSEEDASKLLVCFIISL